MLRMRTIPKLDDALESSRAHVLRRVVPVLDSCFAKHHPPTSIPAKAWAEGVSRNAAIQNWDSQEYFFTSNERGWLSSSGIVRIRNPPSAHAHPANAHQPTRTRP